VSSAVMSGASESARQVSLLGKLVCYRLVSLPLTCTAASVIRSQTDRVCHMSGKT
jgi:hypothetical protein